MGRIGQDWISTQTYYPGNSTESRKVFNEVVKYLKSLIKSNYSDNSPRIKAAVNFLGLAASNEQQKEIDSIKDILKDLQKDLKLEEKGKESILSKAINNPNYVIEDPMAFYTELTLAINKSRQGIEEAKKDITRVKAGINKAKNELRNVSNYYKEDARFAVQFNMATFAKRLMGEYETIDESKFAPKIQRVALEALIELGIVEKLKSGEDFMAVAAATLTDLSLRAQPYLDQLLKSEKNASFDSLSNTVVEELKNEYIKEVKNNESTTKMQSILSDIINDIQSTDVTLAISNTKQILGIKKHDDTIGEKRLSALIQKQDENMQDNSLESTLAQFHNIVKDNVPLSQSLYTITFTNIEKSKSAFGDINELIEGLVDKKISENVATDLVSYRFNYKIERNDQQITNFLNNIDETLSKSLKNRNKLQDKQNISEISNLLTTMNNDLINIENQMEEYMGKIDDFPNRKLFIYHESLKLSSQAETKSHAFKGRTMSILSYIATLDSMNTGLNSRSDTANSVDTNELEFLAYNLFPGSAGDVAGIKGPLEKYFSIFAGMLMFDDVANMTTEAVQEVQSLSSSQRVEQIHLYNLNGVYVPASLILSSMHRVMQDIAVEIEADMVAKAQILIDSSIQRPNKKNDYKPDSKISNIQVRITFLAGFMALIESLFSAIS